MATGTEPSTWLDVFGAWMDTNVGVVTDPTTLGILLVLVAGALSALDIYVIIAWWKNSMSNIAVRNVGLWLFCVFVGLVDGVVVTGLPVAAWHVRGVVLAMGMSESISSIDYSIWNWSPVLLVFFVIVLLAMLSYAFMLDNDKFGGVFGAFIGFYTVIIVVAGWPVRHYLMPAVACLGGMVFVAGLIQIVVHVTLDKLKPSQTNS